MVTKSGAKRGGGESERERVRMREMRPAYGVREASVENEIYK